jgi:hypothetical protein
MERRFELRKAAMLAECEVAPQVFRGALERLAKFVKPFAELLTQLAQRQHTADYLSGLISDLKRKNVESIAHRHDQDRRNLQHFIGCAEWDHQPLMMELAKQVGEELGEDDGVIVMDPSAFPKPTAYSPAHGPFASSRATVRDHMGLKRRVRLAAIDSTGLESSAASGYFVRRRERVGMPWKTVVYHHFPKLGVVCDVEAHLILAAQDGRGPKPDVADFRPLVSAALLRVAIDRMAADAGFDSEANHTFARQECHIRSIIPPKHGRPTTKPASGHYRRLM